MKVVIAGGTGALGRRLAPALATRGHDVVVLTRRPPPGPSTVRHVAWDIVIGLLEQSLLADGGIVHATSPIPVRNAELMATLRDVVRRPPAPPTPAVVVRLGSLILRTDPALALTGRRAVPTRLRDAGFSFRYPELRGALEDVVRRPGEEVPHDVRT